MPTSSASSPLTKRLPIGRILATGGALGAGAFAS
jgi:hypothetical protein